MRRKRKVPIVEYVPPRNIVSSVPVARQTTHQFLVPQAPMVKVVSPKVVGLPGLKNNVKTITVQRNTIESNNPSSHRIVIAPQKTIQIQAKKEDDASRLRQMLEKRQLSQKGRSLSPAPKRMAVASPQKPQKIAQRIVHAQAPQVVTVPDVGSSEEDIETEVIDSSMVEVEMKSNSNSPLPGTVKQSKSKVVVQREPNVSVMEEAASPTPTGDPNPLKCDLCNKEFHSLRQRERHRVTHNTKESTTTTPSSTRTKSISLEEQRTASPNTTKQSPKTTPPPTKRVTTTKQRGGKNTESPEPVDEAVIEVTTAEEDSEN